MVPPFSVLPVHIKKTCSIPLQSKSNNKDPILIQPLHLTANMSGLMNKVKDAISGDKHNTNTSTTGSSLPKTQVPSKPDNAQVINRHQPGLENEHGTQSGVHDTPIDGSVAHGSSVSNTNPGILHSTQRGIHGDRDPGVGETAGTGVTGSGYDNTSTTRDTGLGGDSGLKSGPQFTGTGDRDAGLVQSGLDSTGREGGRGLTGSGYDNNRDTGLSGTGSGYDNIRDTGLSGTGSGYDNTRDTGLGGDSGNRAGPQFTGTGERDAGLVQSGLDSTGREGGRGLTGSRYDDTRDTGLTGTGSGYDNTRDVTGGTGTGYDSGVTGGSGTGYDESNRGTGLTGSGYDSGTTGNTSTGTGLIGKAERYVEGSERHHRGDGHPEDIVHPGPHETRTAKALDPHLNQ